ncbi:hypothetical protein RYX36_029177 [Vicia faba]
MSASDNRREKFTGLTLDDVLAKRRLDTPATTPNQPPPSNSQTIFDIIREDDTNRKDRRSWKAFKDKLRLKRAGSAWTSSIHIPTSDIPVQNPNSRSFSQLGRRDPMTHQVDDLDPSEGNNAPAAKPQFTRRSSTRFSADSPENSPGRGNLRPQLSRRNSTNLSSEPFHRGRVVTFRDSFDEDEPDDNKNKEAWRTLSAREAVAAQEAAEAAAAEDTEASGGHPMMSLMDLLEETDREMGLEGSRYVLSDDEDFDDDDDEEDEGEDDDHRGGAMEGTCCVCMVKHKGAAFAPCGHSFCRMCSRELMVAKGNCPLCNNFISEVLEIF